MNRDSFFWQRWPLQSKKKMGWWGAFQQADGEPHIRRRTAAEGTGSDLVRRTEQLAWEASRPENYNNAAATGDPRELPCGT